MVETDRVGGMSMRMKPIALNWLSDMSQNELLFLWLLNSLVSLLQTPSLPLLLFVFQLFVFACL